MSFANINTMKQRGFTIVELLIVIVVIGILAAITVVSYTNLTAQANSSKAQAAAAAVRSVAEAYKASNGSYPTSAAQFRNSANIAALSGDITFVASGSIAAATDANSVTYQVDTAGTYALITYRTFPSGTDTITLGTLPETPAYTPDTGITN
jgi:prepilin-type N-terminal cleavage/methylation domain-containing protein